MSKVAQFIRLMFESRQAAHKAHFMTTVDARHRALEEFYNEIVDLADEFAETYFGKFGMVEDLDLSSQDEDPTEIIATLRRHLDWIETNRNLVVQASYTPLQNVIDEIVARYLRTLFKLERLL